MGFLNFSFLDRSAIVAGPEFNRWQVPPAAIAVHMCIGQVYAFSPFNAPLEKELGVPISEIQWAYQLALIMLGLSAALFGKWVERSGPRKTMVASWLCFCGGLVVASLAVSLKSKYLLLLGYGVLGGIGLGLGYIAPVSTLVKWFPDRPGMATGMAIMGFGGGALVGSPLSQELMRYFSSHSASGAGTGAGATFLAMAAIYTVFMLFGASLARIPADGWAPQDWRPKAVTTGKGVPVETAWKTPQFWFLWIVLCMNVSATVGVLGIASDIIQSMFGVTKEVGAGFVGLLSLFNLSGRFLWSSFSDVLGRKLTYVIYLSLGAALYTLLPWTQSSGNRLMFIVFMAIILSMYGGGFATIPAYLRDRFGTYQVGAIHGRLITAWSLAAIIGPELIKRLTGGSKSPDAYNQAFLVMAGLLVVGFVANLCVKPVEEKHFVH
jgi:MFS family permease